METLRELMSRVLDINKEEVVRSSSPDTISSWDSFNGLMLISELEKNFDVKFTMDETMMIQNVGDIRKALEKYSVTEGLDV